jgi:hypothetical protein
VGEHGAASRVQVRAEVGRTIEVFCHRGRLGIRGVHLTAQGLELVDRDVARTARGRGRRAGYRICGHEWFATLGRQRRSQDIRGGVQIALRMPADQLPILRESHVAFEDAGAHARSRFIGFFGVLGELQRCAPVSDRKIRRLHVLFGARGKLPLERPFVHVVDQVEGPRSQLHLQPVALEPSERLGNTEDELVARFRPRFRRGRNRRQARCCTRLRLRQRQPGQNFVT